jgi:hypothetical protein
MSTIPDNVIIYKHAPSLQDVQDILAQSSELWNKTHHHIFLAIDLEFTRNKFALIQMCFDTGRGSDRTRRVYLSNTSFPGLVELLVSPHLVKLLHGSESNDVPWLLSVIPESQRPELFVNFIDTRFVAEYLNPDLKPGLYDVLARFNAITPEHVLVLLKIEKSMGHVQHVDWRLDRIRSDALEYAIQDVIHLRMVYAEARKRDATIPQFRNILRVCFLERFLKVLDKTDIEIINNYHLAHNKLTMIDMSLKVVDKLKVPDLDFSRILRIGYLRPPTLMLLRRIIYGIAVHKIPVMIDKNNRFTRILKPLPDHHIRWSSLDHLIIEIRRAVNHILSQKDIYEK